MSVKGYSGVVQTLQDAAVATGNGTLYEGTTGIGLLGCQVSGTFVGTVTFEGSINQADWVSLLARDKATGATATTATAAGIYLVDVAGVTHFRARVSAYTSGSITVAAVALAFSMPLIPTDTGQVQVDIVSGGSSSTQYAEDAAHVSGDTGTMALGVQKATAAALAAEGDYVPPQFDASGRLHIAPLVTGSAAIGKLAANTGVDIGDVDVTSVAGMPTGTSATQVQGTAAAEAAAVGNPVLMAGLSSTTVKALDVRAVTVGRALVVGLMRRTSNGGDAVTTPNVAASPDDDVVLYNLTLPSRFNGSTWDRARAVHEVTALASAARTASANSGDLVNYNGRAIIVVIDVTASADTPSVVVTIRGKSTLGSDYYTILASAAITGAGVTKLVVDPRIAAVANLVAQHPVPRVFDIDAVAGDADSITYSVSVNFCE